MARRWHSGKWWAPLYVERPFPWIIPAAVLAAAGLVVLVLALTR